MLVTDRAQFDTTTSTLARSRSGEKIFDMAVKETDI